MKKEKATGLLLLIGAVGVLIPYTFLTINFEYPDILRQDTGSILTKFNVGGTGLIVTWFAFAMIGLPLLPAYVRLGQKLEGRSSLVRPATIIGVVGLLVQVIGLLRWTFVVPMLANDYVHAVDPAGRMAAVSSFRTIHQFAGVLLGEHLGQLFTVLWTVLMCICFAKLRVMPRWINVFGIIAAVIYFLAQAELFATVIPGFPVWSLAGMIGSTLWLAWLIIIGIKFLRNGIVLPVLNGGM